MKREEILDILLAALLAAEAEVAIPFAADALPPDETGMPFAVEQETHSASSDPIVPLNGWFLEQLEIEDFRGVKNQGSPLVLKFKPDAVSSISPAE